MAKEINKSLWWRHFRIWIFGILISFPAASVFGVAFNDQNPNWVMPIAIAILAFPLVLVGAHSFKHRYSMYGGLYQIIRGKPAVAVGIFCIALYVAVVALAALYFG